MFSESAINKYTVTIFQKKLILLKTDTKIL